VDIHVAVGFRGGLRLAALLLGALVAPDAHATLGGDAASIAVNEQHLGGVRHVTKFAIGERQDIVLASGASVREYLSPTGAVYAVTWRGPRMPDLRELLGPYLPQLSQATAQGGHHATTMVGNDLVVQSMGHRGSFVGRAWVPSLVPAGVDVGAMVEAP
jgi:Protein of unknown function (DUF2844)